MKDYCTTHFHACDCREEMHREEIEKLRESVEKFKYDYICRRNAAARESESHSATFTKLETANTKIKQLEEKLKVANKIADYSLDSLEAANELIYFDYDEEIQAILQFISDSREALAKIRGEQKDTDKC